MTLNQILVILRRRKWSFILPAVLIFLAAAAVARFLPPIYKTTSTILIEEQEIPTEFVQSTVTGYAEHRIQAINQRIMSFSKLLDIIERFKLYPDLQERWPAEQIVEKMRNDIHLKLISADAPHQRSSKTPSATIAFTLSYEGKDPDTVQRVTNELTSLFLSENLRVRERKSMETSQFIEEEMKKAKISLAKLDEQISAFKSEHIHELPDLLQVNQQSLNNIENNITRLDEQLRSLKEKKQYLETQLANTPPELEIPDKKRLEELRLELVYLQTRFTEQYPDVIKAKEEISKLEKKLGGKGRTAAKNGDLPDNPLYVTLASQLAGVEADIDSLNRQIKDLEGTAAGYQRRIQATPKVEEAYQALILEQTNLQGKYSELMKKLMEANVAYGLEKEQMGERFTLLDPARFPQKPHKPNRLLILLVGLVLGVGAGCGLVFLRENMDPSLHDAVALNMATGAPVLAAIPDFEGRSCLNPRRLKAALARAASLLLLVKGLAGFR